MISICKLVFTIDYRTYSFQYEIKLNSELENWLSYHVLDQTRMTKDPMIWSHSWSVESFGKKDFIANVAYYVKSSSSLENSPFWIHLDLQLSVMILITCSHFKLQSQFLRLTGYIFLTLSIINTVSYWNIWSFCYNVKPKLSELS